jgi:hypothetical protein
MCLQLRISRLGSGELGDGICGSNSGLPDRIGGHRGLARGHFIGQGMFEETRQVRNLTVPQYLRQHDVGPKATEPKARRGCESPVSKYSNVKSIIECLCVIFDSLGT